MSTIITALDYISDDDDMIVPGTPDSRAEGEEPVKPFLIERLPKDIIKYMSVFCTIEEIKRLKYESRSRILLKQLDIHVQQTHVNIENVPQLLYYFSPTVKAVWVWARVQELHISLPVESLRQLDQLERKSKELQQPWFLCSRRVPMLRSSDSALNLALGYVIMEDLTEVHVTKAVASDVFEKLQGDSKNKPAEKLEILTIETENLCSYGTQLPLTFEKELPNLRVLKLPKTTKFFLQEQKTLTRWCPKLERVEEARTTWEKINGFWFAETEATEVKVQLSTKRKRLTLEEVKYAPGEVFRCSNCNGKPQRPYMAPEVSLCGHCFTGTKNLVELQNQIDKFKKQRTCNKCPQGAICKCERVLALDDFMLTDYPVQ